MAKAAKKSPAKKDSKKKPEKPSSKVGSLIGKVAEKVLSVSQKGKVQPAKVEKKPAAKLEAKKPVKVEVPAKKAAPVKEAPKKPVAAGKSAPPVKAAPAGKPGASSFGTQKKVTPVQGLQFEVPAYLDKLPDKPVESHETREPRPVLHSSELFTKDELTHFLQLLKAEKAKLLDKARAAVGAGNIVLDKDEMYDEVDLASATVEQSLTFRLLDRDRKLLGEIDHAISKVHTGEYGYCEGTGEAIPKRRLELRPWTRHSVKYKEQLERMKKSGRGVVDEDELQS